MNGGLWVNPYPDPDRKRAIGGIIDARAQLDLHTFDALDAQHIELAARAGGPAGAVALLEELLTEPDVNRPGGPARPLTSPARGGSGVSCFSAAFGARFQSAGIKVIHPVPAPRMNSIMERWIGSCRRELLDQTLIWTSAT